MPLPDDIEIARSVTPDPIETVGDRIGLSDESLERYGPHIAKVSPDLVSSASNASTGTVVLVTAMTPTPRGAGKTVTTVGLGQALSRLDERVAIAIREPSLGPVFGMKGGAAGGGYSQVLPMDRINLHFTGDLHAITAAHNLLAASLDAHIHHGNELEIDVRRDLWNRTVDMNDRALREIVVGLGGTGNGYPREGGFDITAASEVMAILCLATDYADLKRRIERIVVGYTVDDVPVTAADIGVAGAAAALLKDALRPNLVGTIEGTPAFVHGGPFANIAHGTNAAIATLLGMDRADYLLTEAGFSSELGAEKFINIVSRKTGITPNVAVLVVTIEALKRQGIDMWPVDNAALQDPDPEAVRAGLDNACAHVDILETFGIPAVVAINRFPTDTAAELEAVTAGFEARGIPVATSTVHPDGGEGGIALASEVQDQAIEQPEIAFTYTDDNSVRTKIEGVATEIYGASGVEYVGTAQADIDRLESHGFGSYPVCVSKTPYSLSDDPAQTGVPTDWELTVRAVEPAAGAGYLVVLTGDVLRMPGLPAEPAAMGIDLADDGTISGLF